MLPDFISMNHALQVACMFTCLVKWGEKCVEDKKILGCQQQLKVIHECLQYQQQGLKHPLLIFKGKYKFS